MKGYRRPAYAAAGGMIFGFGMVMSWLPGPSPGPIIMAIGGTMLLKNSETARNTMRRARKKSKFLDKRITWFEDKLPWLSRTTGKIMNRTPGVNQLRPLRHIMHTSLRTFNQTLRQTRPQCEKALVKAKKAVGHAAHEVVDAVKHPSHMKPSYRRARREDLKAQKSAEKPAAPLSNDVLPAAPVKTRAQTGAQTEAPHKTVNKSPIRPSWRQAADMPRATSRSPRRTGLPDTLKPSFSVSAPARERGTTLSASSPIPVMPPPRPANRTPRHDTSHHANPHRCG